MATLARQCFEGFRDALMTGDGELFAVRVVEDVVFRVPVPSPDWQGEQRGRDRVRALIAFEYETLGLRARFVEKARSLPVRRPASCSPSRPRRTGVPT